MLPNFFTSSIREQSTWLPEIAFGVFVLMFVVNIFKGRDSNTKKAVYWATQVGGLVTKGDSCCKNWFLQRPRGTLRAHPPLLASITAAHLLGERAPEQFCKDGAGRRGRASRRGPHPGKHEPVHRLRDWSPLLQGTAPMILE